MHVRDVVRACAVPSRSLQDLRSNRGIRSLVADHIGFHSGQASRSIAADCVRHFYGVAFWMQSKAFFATKREFHRAAGHLRKKRGLSLNAHVFLAAKCSTVGHQGDEDVAFGHSHERRDLTPVVKNSLALRVYSKPMSFRDCNAGFRLEEHVFDELSLEGMRYYVGRVFQGVFNVSPFNLRAAEQVSLFMQLRGLWLQSFFGVGDRLYNFIIYVDRLRCVSGGSSVNGRDRSDYITYTASFFSFGHEH